MSRPATTPRGKHKDLGSRIEKALETGGITGSYAAKGRRLGVSATTVGNILRGHKAPSTELLINISARTGIDMHWLATGQGSMIRSNVKAATPATQDYQRPAIRGSFRLPVVKMSNVREWCKAMSKSESSSALVEEHAESPVENATDRGFYIVVSGIAMDDGSRDSYPDQARAYFEPTGADIDGTALQARHDDDVLVELPGDRILFRRLSRSDEGDLLIALNPSYPDRITPMPDHAKILAVCLACTTSKIRRRT